MNKQEEFNLSRELDRLMKRLDKNIKSESTLEEYDPRDFGMDVLFWRTPSAVVVMNNEDIIILWNPAAEKFFRYPYYEILGKSINTVIVESLRPEDKESLPQRITGKTKDGSPLVMEVITTHLYRSGDPQRYVLAIMRDVTNLVQYEAASVIADMAKTTQERVTQGHQDAVTKIIEQADMPEATKIIIKDLMDKENMPL